MGFIEKNFFGISWADDTLAPYSHRLVPTLDGAWDFPMSSVPQVWACSQV